MVLSLATCKDVPISLSQCFLSLLDKVDSYLIGKKPDSSCTASSISLDCSPYLLHIRLKSSFITLKAKSATLVLLLSATIRLSLSWNWSFSMQSRTIPSLVSL